MKPEASSSAGVAGRSVFQFSQEAGIGRSTFYALPIKDRPAHVKIGTRVVITETPADWLRRIAAQGGTRPKPASKAA
jgi:hypothetical protein